MYNYGAEGGSSSPTLTNVTFANNWASDGGAMYNSGRDGGSSNPTLTNVSFFGNKVLTHKWFGASGGAMLNSAYNGGASNPMLINVSFSGNTATGSGGAMANYGYDDGTCSPSLTNVTFFGNWAGYDGGAMYNVASKGSETSPRLINVAFSGNKAGRGGAMFSQGGYSSPGGISNPHLINVSFSENWAYYDGGAMFNATYDITSGISHPVLTNTLLWGNTASRNGSQIYNHKRANPVIGYSLIEGGITGPGVYSEDQSSVTDNGGNISGDPLFVNSDGPDNTSGTVDDDLRLQSGSPAIDAGINDAIPAGITTDLAGVPRIMNGTVDMGAYEFPTAPQAAFSASPTSGPPPLTVTFADQSSGSPTEWWWAFGDGAISTVQYPTHTYGLTGSFAVTLVITSPFGTATSDSPFHILVTDLPPTYLPVIMKNSGPG
jgi:PKD repeat protein